MSRPAHHPFGPSGHPKFKECLHFEGSGHKSSAASRGDKVHAIAKCILNGEVMPVGVDEEQMALGKACADQARALIADINGVEETIEVMGDDFNIITYGTVDAWGYDADGKIAIIDYKTGDQRDYSAQMLAYAVGLMDESMPEAKAHIYFVDHDIVETYTFTLDDRQQLLALHQMWQEKGKYPRIQNDYCGWCKHKLTCPVWTEAAALAVTARPDLEPIIWDLVLKDPNETSKAIRAWKMIKKMFDGDGGIEDMAKAQMIGGINIPGFKIQNRKGQSQISSEQYLQVIVPKMGTAKAAQAIKVSAKSAQEMWAQFSADPFPLVVVEPPPTQSLVEDKPKRGK